MDLAAIVPVKSFSRAKSRMGLPRPAAAELCGLMLREVLSAAAAARSVRRTVVVTREPAALAAASRFGAEAVGDPAESGVNAAVAAADAAVGGGLDGSVVLPQDLPLATGADIDALAALAPPGPSAVVAPSRSLDGTNALLRSPPGLMPTRYDEGSYRAQVLAARGAGAAASVALIRRLAADVDGPADVAFCAATGEKPGVCAEMARLAGLRNV